VMSITKLSIYGEHGIVLSGMLQLGGMVRLEVWKA
jgi:hypothetical protein